MDIDFCPYLKFSAQFRGLRSETTCVKWRGHVENNDTDPSFVFGESRALSLKNVFYYRPYSIHEIQNVNTSHLFYLPCSSNLRRKISRQEYQTWVGRWSPRYCPDLRRPGIWITSSYPNFKSCIYYFDVKKMLRQKNKNNFSRHKLFSAQLEGNDENPVSSGT